MSDFPRARVFGGGGSAEAPEMRVTGRTWAVLPRFVSALSILRRSAAERDAYLDLAAATGFNGYRVFAGALTWAGQSPEMARERLADLLDAGAARGLAAEVTAVTDSGTGYDWRAHLALVRDICGDRPYTLLDCVNEVGHATQAADVTFTNIAREMRDYTARPYSLGSPPEDEPLRRPDGSLYWPHPVGTFVGVHLDRERKRWENPRRVREGEALSGLLGIPVFGEEPMGADERDGSVTGKQRWNDPALFACLGALHAGFGGGGLHHSQAGLHAVLPGPVQQQCADADVAAFNAVLAIHDGQLGSYRNAGGAGSPVGDIRADAAAGLITRAYSFVCGPVSATVQIGQAAGYAVPLAPGWRVADERFVRVSAEDNRALRIVRLEQR